MSATIFLHGRTLPDWSTPPGRTQLWNPYRTPKDHYLWQRAPIGLPEWKPAFRLEQSRTCSERCFVAHSDIQEDTCRICFPWYGACRPPRRPVSDKEFDIFDGVSAKGVREYRVIKSEPRSIHQQGGGEEGFLGSRSRHALQVGEKFIFNREKENLTKYPLTVKPEITRSPSCNFNFNTCII